MIRPRLIQRAASFSPDHTLRYWLGRAWAPDAGAETPAALWVMHNPSTADALVDDPTVRRVMEFTDFWGLKAVFVINLIPFISSNAAVAHDWIDNQLEPQHERETKDYHYRILETIQEEPSIKHIVAAWGGIARPEDARRFMDIFRHANRPILCLGRTQSGAPIHPLARGKNRPPLADPDIYWSPA